MMAFYLIGIAWILVYYISANHNLPLPIDSKNILLGFGLITVGFLMTTRWK